MDVQTRQAYFDSNEQINLDKEKFDHDWPYLKNIWTVDQTSKGKKATLITYWCKLNRHRNQRAEPKEIKRNRKSKSENACPGRLRIKIFNGDDQVRYHQIVKHSHSMELNDKVKLPASVEAVVIQEVTKGNDSPSIASAVKQTQQYRRYLCTQNVRNIKMRVLGEINGGNIRP